MESHGSVSPRMNRVERVRNELRRNGWSALLVLDASDIIWLTGLHSSNAAVVVTDDELVVATDFRYADAVRALGLDVALVEQSLYVDLGALVGRVTGDGILCYAPSSLSHRAFLQFTDALPDGVTMRAMDGVVAQLRQVKDTSEIEAVRRAAAILDGAYQLVVERGLEGRSERDVAWDIEQYLRSNGATRMSFDAIVAGGANGAFPHHAPSDDLISSDTLVTIDIGCVVDGYCSDCTRTFAVGTPSDELLRAYDVVLTAQQTSLAQVRAGAHGRDIDATARDIITAAGWGDRFGHGLGHGVGIEVHEGPRLSKLSEDVLEPGMIVTVEPGVYLPGSGGVRIEDLVVVTDGDPDVLTAFPKGLITV